MRIAHVVAHAENGWEGWTGAGSGLVEGEEELEVAGVADLGGLKLGAGMP